MAERSRHFDGVVGEIFKLIEKKKSAYVSSLTYPPPKVWSDIAEKGASFQDHGGCAQGNVKDIEDIRQWESEKVMLVCISHLFKIFQALLILYSLRTQNIPA